MKYKNAKKLLPNELLEKVQEYIQGDVIYIPKLKGDKIPWGAKMVQEKPFTQEIKIYLIYI